MKFSKYSKIENTYREKTVEHIKLNGLDSGLWVVVEKIHGSNFSILTDGDKLEIAKRTSTIQLNEHGTCSFFNAHKILSWYGEDIRDLYYGIKEALEEGGRGINFTPSYIQVYGELFGGHYPHEEVENNNHSVKVQNGVWYHPDNEFMVFDVVVGYQDGDKDTRRLLPEMLWREIVGDLGLSVKPAPLISSGSFQECLDHSCEFATYVPGVFGLPDIEDNICEGIVIKPVVPRFSGNGSRVILKKKNDRFKEKSRAKKVKSSKQITENTRIAMEAVSEYVTENRLNNVVSKHGEIKDWSEFGLIMREFIHDVMEDFSLESSNLLNVLEKKEQKQVNKHIGALATPIIKAYFQKNV